MPYVSFARRMPANRIENQVGEIVEAEFLKDVLAVADDGGGAEIEQSRDIFVGLTRGRRRGAHPKGIPRRHAS